MRVFAEHALRDLAIAALIVVAAGSWTAHTLRRRALRWSWALAGLPLGYMLLTFSPLAAVGVSGASLYAALAGASWHRQDIHHGADLADNARRRSGPAILLRRVRHRRAVRRRGWVSDGRLVVGSDEHGLPASIPVGSRSGSHVLVLGATGSGKTVSEAWIASRLIETGHGAIAIDPKGDQLLHDELQTAATNAQRQFLEWTPDGPAAYNPYAHGSETEIADKALAGEQFTEPHYLRQAQRYLGHAIRTMHAAGVPVTPLTLAAHLDPGTLERAARGLPANQAEQLDAYLDSLGERQRKELAGVRDRLSILAESDIRAWLQPDHDTQTIDLHQAVEEGAVVYFRLDADRRALLAQMLGAAIVSDLVTLIGTVQHEPRPTVVLVDEFSAVAAQHVARLFGRARSAGVSLMLGTQELADLKGVGEGLREQVLGNVAAVIAHRQNVPESADLIAEMAGSKPVWVTSQQTDHGLLGVGPGRKGTRKRGYEYQIHPGRIKQLTTGQAVVITPGTGRPTVARIHHPNDAHNLREAKGPIH